VSRARRRPARALVAAAVVAALAAPAARARPAGETDAEEPTSFLTVPVEVGGELLDARFADLDGDGRPDLLLAVQTAHAGEPPRREIHIHTMGADGALPVTPTQVVPVLDDVIVWGWGNVRDEPGRELLFLTRGGAWSYSPTLPGYRGNIRRVATMDLLFQVPSVHALPSWSYVVPHEPHDLLLLPGGGGLTLWTPRPPDPPAAGSPSAASPSPDAAGEPDTAPPADDYVLHTSFGGNERSTLFSVKAPAAVVVSQRGLKASLEAGDSKGLFLEDAPANASAMLQAEAHYRSPALVDVNGDGRTDLLLFKDDLLHVYLGDDQGLPEAPTRTESVPGFLDDGDGERTLELCDLDGDGDMDILARLSPKRRSVDAIVFTYYVLLNDGARMLPDQPQQVLRFEGSGTTAAVADVNADGRPDLVITKWELPSFTDVVTGFRMERGAYVYFASGGDEPFERKPALRDEQAFSLESLPDALVKRFLSGDLSGDGLADLVEVDLTGHVAIRRVVREKHFLGRDSWSIEADPWKRFDLGADLSRLQLQDVNGDGIADIINPGAQSLTVLLSRRTGEDAR
jgi:hypothetical protein